MTLVDAKHVHLHLEDSSECKEQIAFADVLVLNKCDLVTPAQLDALARRVTSMNAMARVLRATDADVPIPSVLDVGGFDLERALTTHAERAAERAARLWSEDGQAQALVPGEVIEAAVRMTYQRKPPVHAIMLQ